MKILIIGLLLTVTSCGVNSSSNVDIDPNDIRIIRKGKNCFAVVATRKSFDFSTTGLGLAHIPCNK